MKLKTMIKKALALTLALILMVPAVPAQALSGGTTVTTTPVQQFCGAYINLGGVNYLCAVDLGAPTIDSASDSVMTAGTTVRLDLYFSINDAWYACRKQEMQGDPNSLFTVRFTKNQGGNVVTDPVWKTYPDDGYGERYYLEFKVVGDTVATPVDVSIALTQPDVPNVGADYRIVGTAAAWGVCTANFNLPGYSGPCDIYLGDPVTSTGNPAAMTPGSTVCFPLMFMGGDGQLYAAYNTELQGNPGSLFTVEQSSSGMTNSGWKTWDNGHWYLEYNVGQGNPGDALSASVQLRQNSAYKASPAKSFAGTMGQKGQLVAPISIGGVVYDCTVDLQGYLTSTGDDQNMTADSTICFPLMFQGGDGQWYPVLQSELQGDPNTLFTRSETITSGNALLTCGGWKTWDGGHYYLEYKVADSQYETQLGLSVQLKQDSAYRQGAVVTFTGKAPASTNPAWRQCVAPISIGGTVYDCIVDLKGYTTSSGSDTLTGGGSIYFPLMFQGGDGQWYPVLANELQGHPDTLFEIREAITAGGHVLRKIGWIVGSNGQYYLEYAAADQEYQTSITFSVTLIQNATGKYGDAVSFAGKVPASTNPFWDHCHAGVSIDGTVYTCAVDLQGYLTSTDDNQNMTADSTICFPLMFLGGDGQWYPVYQNELQGDPVALFAVEETIVSGGTVLKSNGWKLWDNGHYYLEYLVADSEFATDLDLTVTLKHANGSRKGVAVQFTGKAPASENPFWDYCHADISLGGTVYTCAVDLQGYLTSTGDNQNMIADSTICFPLMFLGGDGQWYPVLQGELQGNPAALFAVEETIASGGSLLKSNGWKTWDGGHYYLEYVVADSEFATDLDLTVTLKHADGSRTGVANQFVGKAPASTNPIWTSCRVPISIGGTVYECIVDLQGYLTSSGTNTLENGGTIAFPLMFQGGDGLWYPVLKSELQGDPAKLLSVDTVIQSGKDQLIFTGWGSWDNGHYYAEYKVAGASTKTDLKFTAQLKQDDKYTGTPVSFTGTIAALPADVAAPCTLPIKIDGTVYDCIVDLQGYLTSSGTTTLTGGGTVAFPLMFKGGDGQWYPVLKNELQGDPAKLLNVVSSISSGKTLLTKSGWGTWDNGHYYLEYKVADTQKATNVIFSVQLRQSGSKYGAWVTFSGNVPGTKGDMQCVAPIKIDGTVYDCIVDLQGALTSTGTTTLSGNGTIAFPLMFMGGDGQWYPVLKGELQGDPAELFGHKLNAVSGGDLLTCNGWGYWEGGHYYLEYKVGASEKTTELKFGVTLTCGDAVGAEDMFEGYVQPGPDISCQQIPLKPSASLVVERIEECEDFNTMSFTINGIRYNDGWPIDFESPNTTSAVITDGTIIRADLCFQVNGQWYPVRQQECNESIEDLFTYDYQVLSGEEFLGVPRFTTRYDAYGDIWQFEVSVNSEEEGEFCFTLQLKAKDGSKTGSKYKVTGRVQNGQMTSTVEELPKENGSNWIWIAVCCGTAIAAAAVAAVLVVKKKKHK